MKKFFSKFLDKTFLKFLLCGVINTLFGTGINFICLNFFHWDVWFSSAADYILSSVLSFFLNRYFTFKTKGNTLKVILRFSANIVVCYLVSNLLAQAIAWMFFGSLGELLRENLIAFVGLCIFISMNYFSQRFWVFKEEKE